METNSSTSSFKRFLLRFLLPTSLALVALCLLADWLVTEFVIFNNQSSGAYKIHRLFEETHPDEIAILGSSRAAGSYVPELVHQQAFNYGIEKTQYRLTSIFLEEELRKNKATPIIINFDYEFFREWFGNISHFIPNLNQDSISSYCKDSSRFFYHLPALRYYGVYDDYYKTWLAEHTDKNYLSRGGFFLLEETNPEAFAALVRQRKTTRSGWSITSAQEMRWRALLQSTDREIMLVVAPYHQSYFERFTNLKRGKAWLAEMDALPNVTVLDYGETDYPDNYFMNTSHLNFAGAKAFSATLGEALKARGY